MIRADRSHHPERTDRDALGAAHIPLHLLESSDQLGEDEAADRILELFLVGEVAIEGPVGDAGRLGHLKHRSLRDALLPEDRHSGPDEMVASGVWVQARPLGAPTVRGFGGTPPTFARTHRR